MDRESWAWQLSRAAGELGAEHDEQRSAAVIVSLARDVVPHARHASLLVPVRRGRLEQRASTSAEAEAATAAQLELSEGPCLEVQSADGPVGNARAALAQRWPAWGPRADELGVPSVLVVALRSGDAVVGILCLYAEEAAAFSDANSVELASLFAVHAAQAYAAAARIGGLEMALESRHLIGVAQGVLMLRYGLTIDSSFQLLRRTSSQTNVRLTEIAREVAETGDLPRPREPGDDLL